MRKNQGFTLIELLIVIAIIAIIAAVAIPNLLQAHIRSNEANAAAALRKYAEAQRKFRDEKAGILLSNSSRGGAGGYADDFSKLRLGHPAVTGPDGKLAPDSEKTLDLIEKEFAAARGPGGVPFKGYLFAEPEIAGADDPLAEVDPKTGGAVAGADAFWANRFALLAVPSGSGRSGSKVFYIDDEGVIMMKDAVPETSPADAFAIDTPLKNAPGWVTR